MRSLPPSSYQDLAKLEMPASYVCVVRDVDSDCYRIDATRDLPVFIESLLVERAGDFGIELLAIVQTSDLEAFADLLRERYDAALGGEWMSLDDYQMRELRGSILQINTFHSQYLRSREHHQARASAGAKVDAAKRSSVETSATSPVMLEELLSNSVDASPQALRQARPQARRPIQTRYELWNEDILSERGSTRQRIDNKITDFMVNHPGLVIAIILLIALIMWFTLESTWQNPYSIR